MTEILIQGLSEHFIQLQHALTFVQLRQYVTDHLDVLFLTDRRHKASPPGRIPHNLVEFVPLIRRQLVDLKLPNLVGGRTFHLVASGRHGEEIVFGQGRLPAVLFEELLFFGLYFFAPLRKHLHDFLRNPFQIEPDDPPLFVPVVNRFVTEFPAFPGQMVVVDLAGIPDRPAHLQRFERLVTAVLVFGHVHHDIVGVKLRVK